MHLLTGVKTGLRYSATSILAKWEDEDASMDVRNIEASHILDTLSTRDIANIRVQAKVVRTDMTEGYVPTTLELP